MSKPDEFSSIIIARHLSHSADLVKEEKDPEQSSADLLAAKKARLAGDLKALVGVVERPPKAPGFAPRSGRRAFRETAIARRISSIFTANPSVITPLTVPERSTTQHSVPIAWELHNWGHRKIEVIKEVTVQRSEGVTTAVIGASSSEITENDPATRRGISMPLARITMRGPEEQPTVVVELTEPTEEAVVFEDWTAIEDASNPNWSTLHDVLVAAISTAEDPTKVPITNIDYGDVPTGMSMASLSAGAIPLGPVS